MSEKFRCSVCNKVDSQDIETEVGDFLRDGFYPDPTDNNKSMCRECIEWHQELMGDYQMQDDIYGWYAFEEWDEEGANDNQEDFDQSVSTVRELPGGSEGTGD